MKRLSIIDIDPAVTPETWPSIWQELNDTGLFFSERENRRKDGTLLPVEIYGNLLEYGDQQYAIAFAQDISGRYKMEAELRRRERMLRRILDIVPSMIFAKNGEGRFLMANQAIADSLSMTVDTLVGRLHQDVHPDPDQVARMLADDRQAMDSGETVFIVEEPYLDSAGVTRWLQTIKVPCDENEFGEPAIVGLATDITERKQSEEELRRLIHQLEESEARFKALHNASFGGITIHDKGLILECNQGLSNIIDSMPSVLVGEDRDSRVTQWNRQAEAVTGVSVMDAQSRYLADVFPRLMRQMDNIKTAIRERRVLQDLKVPRERPHETCYEDITIFPLVANGVEGAVIRVDDVTQQVRLEEMMIQSEKMLSVGGLAAGMAHEINNPLAGIVQSAAVLENRLLGGLPANHQAADTAGTTLTAIQSYATLRKLPDLIGNIRESGSRAAAIVRNMLSFARKSEKVVSSNDLGALLDQTLDLLKTDYDMKKHYDFKQIRIRREYDPVVSPVPCEAGKLQQVFMNILKNGAEAMAETTGASAPPAFMLRVQDDGAWVRVEIEDNGPGMDERTRRRIFEPFFTTKPSGKGTGLGLSVSYFIVTEDHGGEMSVHVVDGGGSCFVIRLPKGRSEVSGQRSEVGESETG